jgi:hypothetical protein
MLDDSLLRFGATTALVGSTVGSLELLLSYRAKGSIAVLVLAVLTFSSCLVVHLYLSQARTQMVVHSVSAASASAVTIQGAEDANDSADDHFTQEMLQIFGHVLPKLAFALETAGGLLLYAALCFILDPGVVAFRLRAILRRRLERRLKRERMGPFWTRERLLALVLAILILGLLAKPAFSATTGDPALLRQGYILDLSTSRTASEIDDDVKFIGNALTQAPLGSRIIVAGVTEDGFSQPKILLDARINPTAGFMGHNVSRAHAELLAAWRRTAASLQPRYPATDIAGTLIYVARLLGVSSNRPGLLVVLSDGRQTRGVDLEKTTSSPSDLIRQARYKGLLADLTGARMAIIGVSTHGRSQCYFQFLRTFWTAFAEATHANLTVWSIDRDLTLVTSAKPTNDSRDGVFCEAAGADTQAISSPAPGPARTPVAPVAAPRLAIVSPAHGSIVEREFNVEFTGAKRGNRYRAIVHPLGPGSDTFWSNDWGEFREGATGVAPAIVGREGRDCGVKYELRIFENPKGAEQSGPLPSWPQSDDSSIATLVIRGRDCPMAGVR